MKEQNYLQDTRLNLRYGGNVAGRKPLSLWMGWYNYGCSWLPKTLHLSVRPRKGWQKIRVYIPEGFKVDYDYGDPYPLHISYVGDDPVKAERSWYIDVRPFYQEVILQLVGDHWLAGESWYELGSFEFDC